MTSSALSPKAAPPTRSPIYRGHFLPDFAVPGGLEFEHWADAERTRLRLMFLRAAESVVRASLSTGHVRDARELAIRVRDGNLQSEAAWRLHLETLVAGHDIVGALAEAERLLTVLRQDGRTPDPATRALLRAIQQDPEQVAAPATGLAAELVGREREFAAIVEAWDTARGGRTMRLHVTAPAGLGKTRLLLDVQARIAASGGHCVYARANPGERAVPFAFAAELAAGLAQLGGAKGISPASASALVALNPALSSVYSQPADGAVDDEAARRRTLALTELVRALAEDAPLAVLVDDLHWVDLPSRHALDAVAGRLGPERVLLVTAARAVPGVEQPREAPLVPLLPLSLEQVTALLVSLAALRDDLPEGFAQLVLDASGGSPLLALESLQAAIDAGLLELHDGAWRSPDSKALAERLSHGSAVRDRVALLERNLGWLLLLLATGGVPVSSDALAAAAGRSPEAVNADLLDLERRGFVQRVVDGWEPAHDAIGEAATAQASPEARRAAAAALGGALVRDPDPPRHLVARAAQLLAQGDEPALHELFRRWVQVRRRGGDRRRPAALAGDLLGEGGSARTRALERSLPLHIRLGIDTPGSCGRPGCRCAGRGIRCPDTPRAPPATAARCRARGYRGHSRFPEHVARGDPARRLGPTRGHPAAACESIAPRGDAREPPRPPGRARPGRALLGRRARVPGLGRHGPSPDLHGWAAPAPCHGHTRRRRCGVRSLVGAGWVGLRVHHRAVEPAQPV
jgi:hypothetical protein